MKTIFSMVLFLAITLSLVAQAPQGINYQTVIRNSSGNVLANTNVSIKINIRSTSASGTIVYAETHAVSTNQFGLVNFAIGQGTVVAGTFVNINWGNGTYFAETLVDPAGGNAYVTVGAQQLMSVPYALNAGNGNSWKDSSIVDSAFIPPTLRPAITSHKDAFVFDNSFLNGTKVGTGNIELWGNQICLIDFKNRYSEDFDLRLELVGTPPNQLDKFLSISTKINGLTYPSRFVFTQSGRMGIGTTKPRVALDVNGDVSASNSDTSNIASLSGNDGALILRRKNDMAYIDFKSTNDTSVRISSLNNGLVFNTGQTLTSYNERLRILSNGKIGIGNSNPKSKLTVTGGDVNITDIASGIILKSPNGNCWRVTIDNSGNLIRTSITCP